MGFAEGLVQDLADFEALQRVRGGVRGRLPAQPSGVKEATADDLRPLALLRSETLRVAALVAAAASLARHGETRQRAGQTAEGLDLFAPSFSPMAGQQMAVLAAQADFFDLHQLWQHLEAKLAFAVGLAQALAAGAGQGGGQSRGRGADLGRLMPLDVLADAWMRAAGAMLDWHGHLARVMAARGVTCSATVEAQGLDLLRRAAVGESPCVDADGVFSLPGWAERRQERRRPISLAVDLAIGVKRYPARLDNLSRGGMQLVVSMLVPSGTKAAVVLPDGRSLAGTVRWCDGARLGFALATALSDADDLWHQTPHPAGLPATARASPTPA